MKFSLPARADGSMVKAHGGIGANTVAEHAEAVLDLRFWNDEVSTFAEQQILPPNSPAIRMVSQDTNWKLLR